MTTNHLSSLWRNPRRVALPKQHRSIPIPAEAIRLQGLEPLAKLLRLR
jgi:hypothetical protein